MEYDKGMISNLKCPVCGNAKDFGLEVFVDLRLEPDGEGSISEPTWNEDSLCSCDVCCYEDKLRRFWTDELRKEDK